MRKGKANEIREEGCPNLFFQHNQHDRDQLEDSFLLSLDADERKPLKVEYHLEERSKLRISFAWRHPT